LFLVVVTRVKSELNFVNLKCFSDLETRQPTLGLFQLDLVSLSIKWIVKYLWLFSRELVSKHSQFVIQLLC